jgi:hypothetical protein
MFLARASNQARATCARRGPPAPASHRLAPRCRRAGCRGGRGLRRPAATGDERRTFTRAVVEHVWVLALGEAVSMWSTPRLRRLSTHSCRRNSGRPRAAYEFEVSEAGPNCTWPGVFDVATQSDRSDRKHVHHGVTGAWARGRRGEHRDRPEGGLPSVSQEGSGGPADSGGEAKSLVIRVRNGRAPRARTRNLRIARSAALVPQVRVCRLLPCRIRKFQRNYVESRHSFMKRRRRFASEWHGFGVVCGRWLLGLLGANPMSV